MRVSKILLATTMIATAVALGSAQRAEAERPVFEVRAENGKFQPSELVVAAGAAFEVRVTNAEKTPIEFESFELHRERVVQPGETITVYIPALSADTYKFFDDFHRDTPEGAIIVK